MDMEGALLDLERVLLHSLPKSGGAMAPLALPVLTSLPRETVMQRSVQLSDIHFCNNNRECIWLFRIKVTVFGF